ncbi:carbonic anhydrase [Listeria booriae]|uniref:carbonic anhydrase n=1 Tax=Listeria booriae TaxID=1552123 RepID=UPI001628F60F|nr:carbonic anhydrase family protein [Listeria booriae]MBC2035166.1 carbonic anhydrase family protein [Listeria booriae]
MNKKVMLSGMAILASSMLVLGGCGASDDKAKEEKPKTTETKTETKTVKKTDEKQLLDWSYSGKTGPENWGSIKPAYKISDTGKAQSPINIKTSDTTQDAKLKIDYKYQPTMFKVTRKDQSVQAVAETTKGRADSKMTIGGKDYILKEINIHTPSEHELDGKKFDAELQLKHVSTDKKTTIVSIFVKSGKENLAIGDLPSLINDSKKGSTTDMKKIVSTLGLIPQDSAFYVYDGSLTTPATTEGVKWVVYEKPITMSKQQLQDLSSQLEGNNRPVQEQNNRVVSSNQ